MFILRVLRCTLLGVCSLFVPAASAADYLVIDLSAGANTAAYPVSYLDAPPAGGWTDEFKTSKLVLRRIPAGTFFMGSPTDEPGRYDNEGRHQVTLTKEFLMGVFEVTQRQWELVMGNRPAFFNNNAYYDKRPVEKVSYVAIREGGSDDPNVSWPQNRNVNANSFVGRLRARTGLDGIDLPTEAMWEYACRAGTTSAFNNGQGMDSTFAAAAMNSLGRYLDNGGSGSTSADNVSKGTAWVGSYQPNAWGLYDMHGNVWEICVDRYDSNYGPAPSVDPLGGTTGAFFNWKGGGLVSNARNCRSARRRDDRSMTVSSNDYGFRLASHSVPAGMTAVDEDGDGYQANLPSGHPLHDPDDADPYVPFVDTNGNFVPDNYDNDAANPMGDFSPAMEFSHSGGKGISSLRLSVGATYSVWRTTDFVDWDPVQVRLDGVWRTSFRSDVPREVSGVEVEDEGMSAAFYRLEATTLPAP